MSDTPKRDTQFAGFAELVAQELKDQGLLDIGNTIQLTEPPTDLDYEKVKLIIARRAYDLVEHTLNKLQAYDFETSESRSDLVSTIPDLTAWPEETK